MNEILSRSLNFLKGFPNLGFIVITAIKILFICNGLCNDLKKAPEFQCLSYLQLFKIQILPRVVR
jgi:hypothetical protein